MKTIYRFEVPIDDQWHEFKLTGHILHVGSRSEGVVEFWAHQIEGNPLETVQLRVFGTGHEMPVASIYRGTTIAPDGYYVWHLVERVDEELYAATTSPSSVSEPMPAELEETP